LYISEQ